MSFLLKVLRDDMAQRALIPIHPLVGVDRSTLNLPGGDALRPSAISVCQSGGIGQQKLGSMNVRISGTFVGTCPSH
ncbi:MAG TPA: hypothetical protein VK098_08730 [Beutenbergiaceae bacterium]|nr:hypothetical protein [Beutenbergiaceae bacterium]